MAVTTDVLAIDDDNIARKFIRRVFVNADMECRLAENGQQGLDEVSRKIPDLILLDVEMPGINGYEVCDRLRNNDSTKETPIIFLSAHSSLQERMQGYEAGGDDYLVKPFEPQHLLAKINVLLRYKSQQNTLRRQYESAKKTAMAAMYGSSQLGMALNFMEKSYHYNNIEELAKGLFLVTDKFEIECTLMANINSHNEFYSSDSILKPLENELLEKTDKSKRFFDFGAHTIVNFPSVSLLVRNMPLGDMEYYGQVKDMLPVLLSAANTRINNIQIESALLNQSKDLLQSIGSIRSRFYHLIKDMIESQRKGNEVMHAMRENLNMSLFRMGLESDQEESIMDAINSAIQDSMLHLDSTASIHSTMTSVLDDIKSTADQQESLVSAFIEYQNPPTEDLDQNYESDIELF